MGSLVFGNGTGPRGKGKTPPTPKIIGVSVKYRRVSAREEK
jgi:hypothetical protein